MSGNEDDRRPVVAAGSSTVPDLLETLVADLPDGLSARAVRWVDGAPHPDDVELVVGLVERCDLAAVGELDSGRDETVELLTSPETVQDATFLVLEGDALRGFLWVEQRPGASETFVDVYADPDARTDEILALGLAHCLRAAEAQRDAAGATEWTARSGCFATDEPLERALAAAGFEIVRRFWRMRADLTGDLVPTHVPDLPAGVEIRVVRDDEGRRIWHDVFEEAFADHWHHAPRTYDDFAAAVSSRASDDPDGWWLLEVDGEPAGVCLLDESRADLGDGYVRTLGVRREHRGHGLAQLLLLRAFDHYRQRGRAGVQLGVDASSPTGAHHLYEKVGMRPARVIDAWAKPLEDETMRGPQVQ